VVRVTREEAELLAQRWVGQAAVHRPLVALDCRCCGVRLTGRVGLSWEHAVGRGLGEVEVRRVVEAVLVHLEGVCPHTRCGHGSQVSRATER
jgi:hypothetical protein